MIIITLSFAAEACAARRCSARKAIDSKRPRRSRHYYAHYWAAFAANKYAIFCYASCHLRPLRRAPPLHYYAMRCHVHYFYYFSRHNGDTPSRHYWPNADNDAAAAITRYRQVSMRHAPLRCCHATIPLYYYFIITPSFSMTMPIRQYFVLRRDTCRAA